MTIRKRDCTPKAVLEKFLALDLPDAHDHDFSSPASRQRYVAAWCRYQEECDVLGHQLAVCSVVEKRNRLTTLISKVSKFVERSRDFAVRAIEAQRTFQAAAKAQDEDPFALFWIFGKPKELRRREGARDKKLEAISDKLTKEYDRLWRERELLNTQIQALLPE